MRDGWDKAEAISVVYCREAYKYNYGSQVVVLLVSHSYVLLGVLATSERDIFGLPLPDRKTLIHFQYSIIE